MKVCFVGVGSIATKHINCLKAISPEITIHAFRTGKSNFISNVKKFIDKEIFSFDLLDENYDAIFICNPTNMHYNTLLQFKDKSNYFFVEKPIFNKSYNEIELSAFNDKNIYVACPLRYKPTISKAKEIIKDKGNPISARIICSSYLPNWRPSIDYRTNYSAHKDMGGGVSIDLIHEIDYMTYLFGFPIKDYYLNGTFSNLEIDSDDLAVHIFQYPNFVVEMHLDYFGKKPQRYLEMFYNDEVIKYDILENKIIKFNNKEEIIKLNKVDENEEQINNFLKFINNKTCITNTLKNATDNLKLAKGEFFND